MIQGSESKKMNKKIIGIFIILFFTGSCILPVNGLVNTKETYLSEKIIENNTNEVYQKNNTFDNMILYENKELEKKDSITTKNNFDSTKRNFKQDGIHISTDWFQSLNKLINRPILWEYLDNVSIPLVSICDNGSFIWVGQHSNNPRFQLFKTIGSGLPVWEYTLPEKDEITLIDSSAEDCVLAGVIFIDYWNRTVPNQNSILFKWDISSSSPEWCFEIPDDLYPGAMCVSTDGSKIVLATYNESQQIIKIFVFNSNSDIPYLIYPIVFTSQYCGVLSLDISNDGSIVLVTCWLGSFIIDVNIPELRWSGEQLPASISGDGSILVYTSFKDGYRLNLLKWDSTENQYFIKWQNKFTPDNWFIPINGHTLAISDDGSTILVGVDYVDDLQNKVMMFDTDSGNILWEHYSKGYGNLQNVVNDIRLSYNGSRAIVGYWGDEFNTIPVIKIFNRESQNPLLNIYFSGSTTSVDISSDGKFGVAGYKMAHANLFTCGGIINAIELKNMSNNPPDKPQTPSGLVSGKIGIEYNYSTITIDNDGDKIFYLFDWGDGNFSEWLGPYNSGATCEAKHTWNVTGYYTIKVKAKDIYGKETDWATLTVTMPHSLNKLLPQFFEKLVQRFPNAFPLLRQLLGY